MGFRKLIGKLKYWQIGGVIGFFLPTIAFVMGIFLTIAVSRSGGSVHNSKFFDVIFGFFINPLCFFNILDSSGHPPTCSMLYYLSPFIFTSVGLSIGLVVEKLKGK